MGIDEIVYSIGGDVERAAARFMRQAGKYTKVYEREAAQDDESDEAIEALVKVTNEFENFIKFIIGSANTLADEMGLDKSDLGLR